MQNATLNRGDNSSVVFLKGEGAGGFHDRTICEEPYSKGSPYDGMDFQERDDLS